MKRIILILKNWLPLAAAITILAATIYITVQQSYRMGADDPQIQLAQDAAHRLASGFTVDTLISSQDPVEISQSLAPYLIIFDAQDHLLASGARLHGQPVEIPAGVLQNARTHGENRVSWQPEPGVRAAIVAAAVGDGRVVVAGRSLGEAEKRIDNLTALAGIGWLAAILVTLLISAVFESLPWTRSENLAR